MTEINEYVEAEFENIERLIEEMPGNGAADKLSGLELSGTAALIHGFYNGIENILKQVVRHKGGQIPRGSSWHRDLITLAVTTGILSEKTAEALKGYFRLGHFDISSAMPMLSISTESGSFRLSGASRKCL